MTVGQRIKQRRLELEMTQSQLAEKVGYKTRGAINKIENDERELTQRKLIKFAAALQTTPAQLMGWNNEKPAKTDELSQKEQMLLELFKKIPEDKQPMVLEMIKAALKPLQ